MTALCARTAALFCRCLPASTLRRQIAVTVALAVIVLAIVTAWVTSWETAREIRERRQLLGQGLSLSLAQQISGSSMLDSAAETRNLVAATLAFPGVVYVEVTGDNGQHWVFRGVSPAGANVASDETVLRDSLPSGGASELAGLGDQVTRFPSPIHGVGQSSDGRESLGELVVAMSDRSLDGTLFRLFGWNFTIAITLGVAMLLLVSCLTRAIIRPLQRLSQTMARAAKGEVEVRAPVDRGPRDIVAMSQVFNGMMEALSEREDALRGAKEDALRLARLKSEFVATMSHELRTPLNGMVGTLDLMRVSRLPPMARRYVELAWDSSQYLLELVNNILDFSSLEAGGVELETSDFDVTLLCEQTIDLVAPQVSVKGLDIAYSVAAEVPPHLNGDARRLRQILLNLVGNAVKFTEHGEVQVSVCLVANQPTDGISDGKSMYRFAVTDTGIGIPTIALPGLFDSFTLAEAATTRRHDGSGLGLAVCKQLVSLMGGRIDVESKPDVGSTFWFEVPLAEGTNRLLNPAVIATDRRILVVDESSVVRQFLEQALISCGYRCQATSSLNEATGILRAAVDRFEPYHVLIVDTLLAAGALQTLQAIRTGSLHGQPRTVLMNRYGAENEPEVPFADAYIAKPLRLERLRACVERVIGNHRPQGDEGDAEALLIPRILIVEDNPTSQTIAANMLRLLGCRSRIAVNGREALKVFDHAEWDLVLMDCSMPEMDGYEATRAIRQAESGEGHRIPILAMTANSEASDVASCLACGMDDHLAKPLTLSQLAACLKRWLPTLTISVPDGVPFESAVADATDREASATVVDENVLARLREVLGGRLGAVIIPFLDDMPGYLERIEAALRVAELDTVRRIAHAIRGAAGNLGAQRLAALALDIERVAGDAMQSNVIGVLEHDVPRLVHEYELVCPILSREIGRSDTDSVPPESVDAPRVLVVDDDRSTRSALRVALQSSGFQVCEASDGSQVAAIVERDRPDVILMDALMPEMDGFVACARLQESATGRDIPVLMITALDDDVSIERAFAVGASDYISKPLHLAVVNQRVRRLVEATRAERHVHQLAYNDLLTGLPNRTLFSEQLNRSIERGKPLALLYLDLDRFKFVNDTLSHEIGDRLLKTAAERLKSSVRATDCVARLGGDEFAIVIDDLPYVNVASATAQKICSAIMSPFNIDGHEITVSASIGIAVYPGDGDNASALLRRADTAMYRAKQRRCGFQFFEEAMETVATERLSLESALRRALNNEEFVVYFQPIANAFDQRVVGMEALVRWVSPERGIVSPADFIPLAEETGLIIPIGEWVLRRACQQLKTWHDAGHAGLYVTVNLSGLQLQEPSFIETLRDALVDSGLDPRYLTLEITESMLMEHVEITLLMLDTLKATGVSLAIDDFGTGYSSLSYLRRFPVDVLKIDQSFTRDMTRNEDDAAIVAGIIALAHNLRLSVVAEGVETENQRAHLLGLRCNHIQGYLLSPPLEPDSFASRFLVGEQAEDAIDRT